MRKEIKKLLIDMDLEDINFLSHAIYRTRRLMGLTQYATAKFLNMRLSRLRNLESGNFRRMINDEELNRFYKFYGIPIKTLVQYCQNEINSYKNKREKLKCDLPCVLSAT